MNPNHRSHFGAAAIVVFVLVAAPAGSSSVVHAANTASISARGSATMSNITNRADQEISRRLTALTALSTRVNAMMRLSADQKSSLSLSIQSQITAMNSLKAKIAADVQEDSTSSLKTDVQSITASYRIFALVLPQGAIEAAADRVDTIVNIMSDLGSKFSTRLSAAANAGANVTAAQSTLADFIAKVSDAKAQAQAADTEVSSLTPDDGDTQHAQSNTAALKDARAKIQAAEQDLKDARTDATTLVKAIGAFKVTTHATTTPQSSKNK